MNAAKADDPFAPVTVLVHSNHEGVALRRELTRLRAALPAPARPHQSGLSESHQEVPQTTRQGTHSAVRRGLVAIEFWTLQRLADELGSAQLRAQGRRPINDLIVAAAIRQELKAAPGMFVDVAEHSATEASLLRALGEVRSLRADQRRQLQQSASARVREVAGFVQRVSQRWEAQQYYDLDALFDQVAEHVRSLDEADTEQLRQRLGLTVLHLPRALPPNQMRLAQAVAGAVDIVVHLGVTGNAEADRPARRLYNMLGAVTARTTSRAATSGDAVCETPAEPFDAGGTGGIHEATADRIISVTDPDEEVRTVVRAVLEDLSDGTAADDIAVLMAADTPYARAVAEQLDAAGVAWNGDAAQSLAESVVGRFVTNLMRLAVEQRLRRVDVMTMLAEAPLRRPYRTAHSTEQSSTEQTATQGAEHAGEHDTSRGNTQSTPGRGPIPAAAWERLARAANVVEDADWVAADSASARAGDPNTRFGRFMHMLDAQIAVAESDPEASEARLVRLRADRERCADLAEFVFDLSQRISVAASLRRWRELSDWLREQIARFLGGTTDDDWVPVWNVEGETSRRGASDCGVGLHSADAGRIADTHALWEAERAAAQRIDSIAERLRTLDAVEPVADASLLLGTLQSQLAAPHGLSGRVGTGIFVGRVGSHAAVPRRRLYLLGMAEGTYPLRQLPDSLIGDADRHAGALTRRSERTDAQHRDLLAALACCIGRSTVTIARGDLRRNAENVPTRWLLPTAQRLAAAAPCPSDDFSGGYLDADNLTAAAASGSIDGLSVSHSYMSGLVQARFPATPAEYDSRELLAAAANGDLHRHRLFAEADTRSSTGDKAFARGVALWRGRQSRRFTRFDGNLRGVFDEQGKQDEHAGFDRVLSASRLEAWATCPRKFLFSYLLGIDEVVEPESIIRLSPIDRGRLIHESLDELLRELIDAAVTPEDLPGLRRRYSEFDRERLMEIGEAKAAELEAIGATGLELLWSFDRETLLADLIEVLDRDEHRSDSANAVHAAARGSVIASEHRFGLGPAGADRPPGPSAAPEVRYALESGRVLRFRGAIDRVERLAGTSADCRSGRQAEKAGTLVVIDYKSGSERPYTDIRMPTKRSTRRDDPTLRGTRLQLGVYALAAAHHFAPGTAVTEAVHQAAYWFVSGRADWAWVTRQMDQLYFERFNAVLTAIVDGIDDGVFVGYVRQGDDRAGFTPCPYCDPDGTGTAEVARQWQRKRDDRALAGFARLAEDLDVGDPQGASLGAAAHRHGDMASHGDGR